MAGSRIEAPGCIECEGIIVIGAVVVTRRVAEECAIADGRVVESRRVIIRVNVQWRAFVQPDCPRDLKSGQVAASAASAFAKIWNT